MYNTSRIIEQVTILHKIILNNIFDAVNWNHRKYKLPRRRLFDRWDKDINKTDEGIAL